MGNQDAVWVIRVQHVYSGCSMGNQGAVWVIRGQYG